VTPPRLELREWQTGSVSGVVLSEKDRALASRLGAGSDGRLVVEELRDGVRVRTSSWIGVVRFERLEVRVEPKLAGSSLCVVQMLEATAGIDALRRNPGVRQLHSAGSDLFDLFALLLVDECERIVKSGMLQGYLEEEEELPMARGRILWDRQVLQRFGRVDRLACRFDELRQDVVENRLLAAALESCSRRARNEGVARRARALESLFREVCTPEKLSPEEIAEIVYDRLNEHYRNAHALAKLVLEARGTEDLLATGDSRCFAFLLDMNALFEHFMEVALRFALGGEGLRVHVQQRNRSILWDVTRQRPYAPVIPDFVVEPLEGARPRLTVDAKYKEYDKRRLDTSDVYQGFLYAFAYADQTSYPRSLILYPSESVSGSHRRLQVRTGAARQDALLDVIGVHAPSLLDELRARRRGSHSTTLAARISEAMGALLKRRPAAEP
jgi:5-methylcytosine-specific restriction enzyme subunit McrC